LDIANDKMSWIAATAVLAGVIDLMSTKVDALQDQHPTMCRSGISPHREFALVVLITAAKPLPTLVNPSHFHAIPKVTWGVRTPAHYRSLLDGRAANSVNAHT
jgi:hypothetical protein